MMGFNYLGFMGGSWFGMGGFGFIIFLLIIWTLVWKGLALWQAARRGEKGWFVVMLVVNTVGLLEILYLYVFSKKDKSEEPKLETEQPKDQTSA